MRGTQNLVLGSPVRGNRSKENVLASKTPLSSRLSNLCAIYHPGRSEASVVGGISMSTIESHCFYPSGKGVSLKPFHTRCCYDKYINPLVTVHRVKCKGGCYMGGGGGHRWELTTWSFPARGFTFLSQTFTFLITKQCPGLMWRLEKDCASGSDFEKNTYCLGKRLYRPTHCPTKV